MHCSSNIMIQSLNHIQRSTPLSQDFEELVDRISRSSTCDTLSSDETSPKHDSEHGNKLQQGTRAQHNHHNHHNHRQISQDHAIVYQFSKKPTKPKNLNLNIHRQHIQNQLKNILFQANIKAHHEREESRESVETSSSLNSSVETPHQRTDDEKDEKCQPLFAKQSPAFVYLPSLSNISTSTSLNVLIFDQCTADNMKPKKVSISIRPNDTTNDVILAVIERYHLDHNVEDYALLYYDDSEEEIADYFPPLARDEIIATKNIDIIAMKYIDRKHYEYEVQSELQSNCTLGIGKDRIHMSGPDIAHFSYAFGLESGSNLTHMNVNRWIDRRVLKKEKEEEKDECEANNIWIIESIHNVSIAEKDTAAFEIDFLLDTELKTSSRSSRSSTIEFIDAGDYRPHNYAQLWNPIQIIPKLQEIAAAQATDGDNEFNANSYTFENERYLSRTLKYFAQSQQECSQIVTKLKGLLSENK